MKLTGALIGDRDLVAKIEKLYPRQRYELKRAITRLAIQLAANVKNDKLSGQVLHRRTGRLSRSVNFKVAETDTAIIGTVGTNVKYGKAWEEGFERKTGAGARGGPRTLKGAARERYFAKHPPGSKQYGPRPFLGPAFDEMRNEILGGIEAALRAAGEGMANG